MTAVVAPICVEDAKLSFRRVASFLFEVVHHLAEVIAIHRKTPFAAEEGIIGRLHADESAHIGKRLDFHLVGKGELGKVLLARLHDIYIVVLYSLYLGIGGVIVENQKP